MRRTKMDENITEVDGSAAVPRSAPSQIKTSTTSIKDRQKSLKFIEKQKNAFRYFRVANAFLKSPRSSTLSGAGFEQDDASGGTDSADDIIILTSFLHYVIDKFSDVNLSPEQDPSIIQDIYYMDSVQTLTEAAGAVMDDVPIAEQFAHRKRFFQVPVDNKQSFEAFRKMLEVHFHCGWVDQTSSGDDVFIIRVLCTYILIFLVNGSDCNPEFGEMVCLEPGLLELLVFFLRQSRGVVLREKDQSNEVTWNTLQNTIQLLYNCSMNYTNRDRLREVGALEAVIPYMDVTSDDYAMSLVALLCVAYLADEKQSKIFGAKKGPIGLLLMRVNEAVASEEKRDSNTWTATELIRGLGRLALNDTNKSLISEAGAVSVLLTQAQEDEFPDEQQDAMEVLWTLTFDDNIKKTVADDSESMDLCERLVKCEGHQCREAAQGILWNIKGTKSLESKGSTTQTDDEDSRPFIMISYQWDSQDLILRIKDALVERGYKVWIDVEKMAGSILEAMANAVENAAVVLVCCSKKYKDSQNCRAEAEYAYKKKKDYIPLIVEKRYSPDGWLGIMIGAKLYYNFSRPDKFDFLMERLTKALGEKGRTMQKDSQPAPPPIVPEPSIRNEKTPPPRPTPAVATMPSGPSEPMVPSSSQPEMRSSALDQSHDAINLTRGDLSAILSVKQDGESVKTWDCEQVKAWMREHNIDMEQCGHLTGAHLHFLSRMKRDAPAVYYKCIQRNLRLTSIEQMAALSNALEEL